MSSASTMTLRVSHQPSSFLAGVAPASTDFGLFSLIWVKTPSFPMAPPPVELRIYRRRLREPSGRALFTRQNLTQTWPPRSRRQNHRSRRFARFQRPVRLARLRERQALRDADLDDPLAHG